MKAKELRVGSERVLYRISFFFSLVAWLVIAITIVGLVYGLFIGFFLFVAHALMIAHIKGGAVKISEVQFPGLHKKILEASRKLGLEKAPEAYVMQAGGALNAFATKFIGRNFIVLYSDLLEACEENGKEMDMIIGHEIGHLALGHLKSVWFLIPARVIPWLWPAYSKAREYSCDRCGYEVAGEFGPAAKGLAILAAGGKYGQLVNLDAFVKQAADTRGFWTSVYELNASHPFLPKRVAALVNYKNPGTVPSVGRHPLAYPLAPMFAMGSPAGAGPLVLVMIIAILAAIAIPQFMTFRQRAEKAVMDGSLKEMASAAQQYQVTKGAWPCTFDELNLPGAAAMAKAKNWEVEVNCEHRLAAVIYKANDGKRHYRAIYFDSGEFEDGTLKD